MQSQQQLKWAMAHALPFSTGGVAGPLWQGAVASAHWLPTSATAAVAGRGGCMLVTKVTLHFWHGSATAWFAKNLQMYHKREKPQAIKKKTKQKEAGRKQIKETLFREMLSMFSIKRRNLALAIFPSHSSLCFESCIGNCLGQLDTENM